jgi:meso-butanediol dehydrogenase/(S,S)-butanediol dehydrogenase/diacetyl reductase
VAFRLAREGANVACLDIARPYADFPGYGVAGADELDEVVREIEGMGRRALAVRADVSSWTEVYAAVAQVHEVLGPIELCCNVAGGAGLGMGGGLLLQISEAEWDRVLDVNLKGTWMVARACAERMIASGRRGRIVNVSSQAGKRGFPMLGAYCAAKAGVILLTQVLAQELGPAGITVNAVCPGTVDTDLLNKDRQFEAGNGRRRRGRDRVPVQRRRGLRHGRGTERQRRADDGVRSAGFQYSRHQTMSPSR